MLCNPCFRDTTVATLLSRGQECSVVAVKALGAERHGLAIVPVLSEDGQGTPLGSERLQHEPIALPKPFNGPFIALSFRHS